MDPGKTERQSTAKSGIALVLLLVAVIAVAVVIALNPAVDYAVVKTNDGFYYIVAESLAAQTMAAGGVEDYEIAAVIPGSEFE